VIAFPNCKINLGLNVIHKRNDGYHDIETVFYPINIVDAIEVIADETSPQAQRIQFSFSGIALNGKAEENLCVRAYELLRGNFPEMPALKMHLHKTIPVGAGLGGGSSDAAFSLRLLNDKFNLKLSIESLLDYALQLGSDCPFFIINKPCFATGRGEFLKPINLVLSNYKMVIANPGIDISTSEVFSLVKPIRPSKSILDIIQEPIDSWKNELKNDFEEAVFKAHSEISDIKNELYRAGALYASMTGTGSTVYGIFEKENEAKFSFPSNYIVRELFGQPQ